MRSQLVAAAFLALACLCLSVTAYADPNVPQVWSFEYYKCHDAPKRTSTEYHLQDGQKPGACAQIPYTKMSTMYQCSEEGAVIYEFSTSNCTGPAKITKYMVNTCATITEGHQPHYEPRYYNSQLHLCNGNAVDFKYYPGFGKPNNTTHRSDPLGWCTHAGCGVNYPTLTYLNGMRTIDFGDRADVNNCHYRFYEQYNFKLTCEDGRLTRSSYFGGGCDQEPFETVSWPLSTKLMSEHNGEYFITCTYKG